MVTLPAEFLWIAVFGAIVGYASGLFGVGGGFMLTPLLIAVFNVDPIVAVGSGLAQLVVVGAVAGWRHASKGYTDFLLVGYMSPGIVIGTWLGKQALHWLTTLGMMTFMGQRISVVTMALSSIFTVMLLLIAFRLWREERTDDGTGTALSWTGGPWQVRLPSSKTTGASLLSLLGAGLFIGVMAGLLGIGGGVVLIPVLVYGFGIDLRMAIGTSALLILVSSIAGVVQYAHAGQIDFWVVAALLVGSTPLVQVGAWHSHRIRTVHLQRAFAVLVFVVACISLGHLFWH
ncbi:MAG: sulfite exporter TauE/SafE family protein [Armatimonadota bacterium]